MSGLLSKAWGRVSEDALGPLIEHIQKHAGVTEATATWGVTAVLATAATVLVYKLLMAEPRNLPPGPSPVPVLGNLASLGSCPSIYIGIDDLAKKYGDIMTLYLGPQRTIIISSYELLKEAFVRQGEFTSDRIYFKIMDIFSDGGENIGAADFCPRVQMQRKLCHQALRKFSSGGGLERYISASFQMVAERLTKNPELDCADMSIMLTYNILLSMCFGKTYAFDDEFFQEMLSMTKKTDEMLNAGSVLDLLPLNKFFPDTAAQKAYRELIQKGLRYIEGVMEEHKRTFDKENLSDFTYHLLNVMEETDNDPNERNNLKLLTPKHFLMVLNDIFIGGTDTTRMTLNWVWHFLAAYPEVQRKAQEEVDEVFSRDGELTPGCRERLPYVEAFVHEVIRLRGVSPLGLPHRVSKDIMLGGYNIPKGSSIMSNNWGIQLDPRYWGEDAKEFRPERWLDERGEYSYQPQGFVTFSMGRRNCVGESFVKLELLLLAAHTLRSFTLTAGKEGEAVSVEPQAGHAMLPEKQGNLKAVRR